MNTATITTPWKGSGTYADPYRPALADDHPVAAWFAAVAADPTRGQPFPITVSCDDATLLAIQNDPKYQGQIVGLSHGS
jgi:hypothetical protein